ncbi:hypothetical protein BU26DRAFT_516990 [Trematosphaeria pertusa]|uniref:Ubiquitin 3 binding protein But2 C-terminal domain-containing protein n=1 Tax=Trematosphaeria pertusa TaxID=390896 RepID=A0A6A6IPJ6_9PLEO|nr:uncharacterized protein BU26DRAFT_516990 [Trematosphaeria pertusa]KAF2252326.1 hypothetical protein BU26DRAFT_516990 [Trematosphaeria pertusa]
MKTTAALLTSILGIASAIPIGQTITPTTISLWHNTGAGLIEYDVSSGLISRGQPEPLPAGHDISTLMTFDFPWASNGKTCEFMFELTDKGNYVILDTPFFDVFRSSQPATHSGPGSNYRDTQLGRMKAMSMADAEKQWGTFTFSCPAGQTKGFEVAPTGDKTKITWNKAFDGPWIRFY